MNPIPPYFRNDDVRLAIKIAILIMLGLLFVALQGCGVLPDKASASTLMGTYEFENHAPSPGELENQKRLESLKEAIECRNMLKALKVDPCSCPMYVDWPSVFPSCFEPPEPVTPPHIENPLSESEELSLGVLLDRSSAAEIIRALDNDDRFEDCEWHQGKGADEWLRCVHVGR